MKEVRELWDELLVPPESCTSKLDQWVLGRNLDVRYSFATQEALEKKRNALVADRDKRKSDMQLFLTKIKSLWKDLDVPEAEQATFLRTLSNSPKDYELVRRVVRPRRLS